MEELQVLQIRSAGVLTSGKIKEAYFSYLDVLDAAARELRKIKFISNVAITNDATVSLIAVTKSSVTSVQDILARQNPAIASIGVSQPTNPTYNRKQTLVRHSERIKSGEVKPVTMLTEYHQAAAAAAAAVVAITATATAAISTTTTTTVTATTPATLPLTIPAATTAATAATVMPTETPATTASAETPATTATTETLTTTTSAETPATTASVETLAPTASVETPTLTASVEIQTTAMVASPASEVSTPTPITAATLASAPTTPLREQSADRDDPLTSPIRTTTFSSSGNSSPTIYSPLLRSASVNIPTKPTRRLPVSPFADSSADTTDVELHSRSNINSPTQLSHIPESSTPPDQHIHPLFESPPPMKPPLPPKPARYRNIPDHRASEDLSLGEDSSDDEDESEPPQIHNPRPQSLHRKTSSPNIAIPKPWRRHGSSVSVPASPNNSPSNIPSSFPSSNGGVPSFPHTNFTLLRQNSSGLVAVIPEGCVDPFNLVEAERINGDDEGELDQKTYGPSDHLPMIPVSPLRTTHRSLVEKEKSWSSMLVETRQRIQEMFAQNKLKDDSTDSVGGRKSEDDTDIQVLQEDACKYTSQIGNIMATVTKVRELLYRSAGITSILEFPPYLVAYQLTLVESAIFLEIPPKALLTHSAKSPHKSITASTDFFNYLTRMIEYSVLFPAEASGRAQIMNHWIKVAVKLHELENFQTLKAIVCALGTPPIKRLKRTWSFLPRKSSNKLEMLSDLMSEDRNYGKYREMMNSLCAGTIIPSPEVSSPVLSDSASASSISGSRFDILGSWNNSDMKAKDASRRPVIPFLGTFIMDMTYLLAAVKKSSVQGSSPVTKVPATSSLRDTNLTVNTSFSPEDDIRIQDLLLTLTAYQTGPRYSPQPSRSYIKASTKSQTHFRAPSLSSALQMTTKYRNNGSEKERQFAFDEDEDDTIGGTGGSIRSMQQLILHYLLTRPWAPERMVDELSTIREPSKNNSGHNHGKSASSGWSSGSISNWSGIGVSSSLQSQSSTTSLDPHTSIHLARFGRPVGKDIHHSVDPETGHVYVAYSTGPAEGVLIRISDLQSPYPEITELVTFPPENDVNAEQWGQVVGVKFLVDIQAICVIFSHGDVVLFHNEPTETGDTLEIVGSVDSGISCMAWSPDEELVIMVTGEGSILEMTKDFDVIAENPIDVEETGEDVSVNVGWGKKETQFHGTEGKQAAQRKIDTSTFTFSPDDDDQHRLSWRGDGTYFCCSSKDKHLGRRVIRVYNREAILQTTSESVDMLEHGLSWRPSGNLIASSQRLPHRHDIVFFERNGLRHGEFTLREPNDTVVKELAWNCDSTVLAVWLQRTTGSCIQLWTMNNYKWYLKQELLYNGEGSAVASLHWDVESALVLHVVTESGSYQRNQYCWDNYSNEMLSSENLGTTAVVDGANLMVTPFRVMNVPPPMSAFTLAVPYAIQHVSFSTLHHGDDMAVLLADQRVAFYEIADKTTRPLPEPKLLGLIELAEVPSVVVRQIAWARSDTLVGLQYDSDVSADSIVVVKLAFDEESKAPKIVSRTDIPLEGLYQRLYFNQTYGDIMLQQADGNLMSLKIKEDEEPTLEKWMEIHRLPEACIWMGTTRIGTGHIDYREKAVVGLARNNRLYVNDRLISSETTSYCLHNHFLVFTTATHSARFLPLETSLSEFKIVDNSTLPYDESIRRVERGSKIVLALPYSVNLILQMPRGNLETVAPRAMVLSVTRDALDKCDFRTAFLTCRKHRIDLNILYDHNTKVFMDNVGEFVKQVKEVDYLNLFLSFLRSEDVTQTLYPLSGSGSLLKQQPSQSSARPNGAKGNYKKAVSPELAEKVNMICDAVRKELETLDRNTYINSVLTTYVRKSPPDLESALLLLAELKDNDQALAEDALKFTIFLADVDRLFDVALGMYDFALVLMVAQWSQKDPREYLPFLNELRTLEKYYQRFKIDDHLKKYQSALQNLSQAGERYFDDCIAYTKQHNLFKFALKVFGSNAVKHKAVLRIYGDSLSVNGDHQQAAIAYSMAGDKEKALDSYKEAGLWREAMVLAQQLKYDDSATAYLARGLAEHLKADKRYAEAGTLLVEYAKDSEEAISALLEGRLWSEAIRTAYLYNRQDLMATHITPGIADGHHDLVESIRDMQEQFDKQVKRLKEVRDLKIEKALAEAAEDMAPDDALDNVDMMSDTTSMASGFSRYTAANSVLSKSSQSSRSSQYTARLKKRSDKKRARGKKGSAYEEEYLINSLRKLILRVDATKSDVHALLRCLAASMSLERAKALQQEFRKLLQDIDEHMSTIFVPPTEEYLAKKKAAEDAKNERKKLIKQNQINAHLMSRHEEAVAQAQIAQLEEIAEQEIADIYGEPPVMSKETWDVDLV
ncbi:hypothetical protein BGX27_002637 [Mortierella sp. AM989]|nr:hypothetical protein BGX27_002637 [Mortierella sp. AM989]